MSPQSTRRDLLRMSGTALGTAGIGALAGCSALVPGGGGGEVVVGSKKFTEQKILGYLSYVTLRENTDLTVTDKVSLGGTTTNFKALQNDQIDTYWEYTGTAWLTLPPKHEEVITDPQQIYERAGSELEEQHDLTFLDRAPFNNTYVLLANPEWQSETGVETISDFASYVQESGSDTTVVMNAEFQERADGWPGLTEAYGFESAASDLTVRNIGSGLTYQVIGEGEAQVGMGFNTNPKILKFDLVPLKDDERFFPVYNPAPLCRMDTLENNQAMREPLNALGDTLSTDTIRELNRRVSIEGSDAKAVARDHLERNDLI
ncbi:glycine betaine ABC transporter substrate-binding protein [Salinigranum sp.]|uniref:glycine betaine ABC transporter substrate-binding protein n=1 Tax=Salinigranum sp. TaxID=1966351 RepID=UPI0035629B68